MPGRRDVEEYQKIEEEVIRFTLASASPVPVAGPFLKQPQVTISNKEKWLGIQVHRSISTINGNFSTLSQLDCCRLYFATLAMDPA